MLMCPHELDMALCGITLKNAAFSLSLSGHPYSTLGINKYKGTYSATDY